MKFLITGAQGQLGQALQKAFSDHEVIPAAHQDLDITRLDDVRDFLKSHPVDWVLNAAAYNSVDLAETDRDAAYQGNVIGPKSLAIAAHERQVPILHVSSDYVFDGLAGRPYTERDSPNPSSAYGDSKLKGELEVAKYNPEHLIVRTAWVYSVTGKNFAKTILRLGFKGDVRVVSDQYGSPTYAPHLALGIRKLIESNTRGLYHLAGNGGTTWYGLTSFLFEQLKVQSRVQAILSEDYPRPAPRPPFAVLETCRTPKITLPFWQDGVKEFAVEIKPYLEELKL